MGKYNKYQFENSSELKLRYGNYQNYVMDKPILSQAEFDKNADLQHSYGTYDNYVANEMESPEEKPPLVNENYTMEEVVAVENEDNQPLKTEETVVGVTTPSATQKKTTNPNNINYMEEARNIYNQSVQANNRNAENQAAVAGAQYRELNRNVNELNKASGKANTGYAGEVSIDAYNAYRNAVNQAYANAEKSNNDLYSYYLSEVSKNRDYEDAKETNVLAGVNEILAQPNSTNPDGSITDERAEDVWNYVKRIYGENVPDSTLAYLETKDGFSEWLNEYNSQTNGGTENYTNSHNKPILNTMTTVDADGNYAKNGVQAMVIGSAKNNSGGDISDTSLRNFRVDVNGTTYYLETGKESTKPDESTTKVLNNLIKNTTGREPVEGDLVYYNNVLYVVTNDNTYRRAEKREAKQNRDDYDNLLKALGIK